MVVSGGAVNSPQLLELSGIGGGALLRRHGIPVLFENEAVGENMQDHLGINYVYRAKTHSLNQVLRPWWGQIAAGVQYLALGRGPLSLSLNQGGAFVKTRPGLDRANIQIYLQAISTFTGKSGTRPLLKPDPFPGFALGLSNCRPTSVGSIHIGTPDPLKPPRIVPNGLSTAHDVQDALEGVKLLRHIAAQPSLAAVIEEELAPGPKAVTDDDLVGDFRQRCGTVYHPMGTCRMGPAPGAAVVDARLRVHGVEALRVVDASAFPAMITGNTNAPSMMIGAKAVDLILADAR
jgi:choline dehydrogenase